MILIYLSQVGSAQFLLPILKDKNIFNKFNFFVLSSFQTKKYLDKNNIKNKKISELDFNVFNFIEKNNPSKIILSATLNNKIEKEFILFSRLKNIKTFSFIDMWSNYSLRFLSRNKLILPDYILTIDSMAKKEMIAEKIPHNLIKTAGHPYFEELALKKIPLGNYNIFYSQPLSINTNPNIYYPKNFLFDRYKKFLPKLNQKFTYISLHPNELEKNIVKHCKYNFRKSRDFKDLTITKNAFGLYSTQLISAYILKRNVYVFGYRKMKYDPFPLSRWGIIKKIYTLLDYEKNSKEQITFNMKFINSFIGSKKRILNILLN